MSNDATPQDAPVISSVTNGLGRIELNRPRAINALNEDMVIDVNTALADWRDDDAVSAVLVTGRGERGLCAGGDIKAVHRSITEGTTGALDFFSKEYVMNDAIAEYPKPYVAIMNGVTMGGGVGISAHGSIRVVTDSTTIGMPETGIGLFPDVGATYLLARTGKNIGIYLGLTSEAIGAGAAIAYGLADTYVPDAQVPALIEALTARPREAAEVVAEFAQTPPANDLAGAESWIEPAFSADDATQIVAALRARPEEAARTAADTIESKSPRSVELTLRMIRTAADMDLRSVLERDLQVALTLGTYPDLVEGIRAQVIDKDRNPQWNPATLDGLPADEIDTILTTHHDERVFA